MQNQNRRRFGLYNTICNFIASKLQNHTSSVMSSKAMWMTLDLLVAKECRRSPRDLLDELEDWLDTVTISAGRDRVRAICDAATSAEIPELPRKTKKATRQKLQCNLHQTLCSFSHPHTRSRLEKLMGSNIVRLTDREYMQQLQDRICEDRLQEQRRRMQDRRAEEVEREKKLILEGKIPVKEASKELLEHPVFKITQLTKDIIEEQKAKVQPPAAVPSACSLGNADDPAPVLSSITERRCSDLSVTLHDSDVTHSVVFKTEVNDGLKYECPLVKKLRDLQTVDEMYALAEEITGPLRTVRRRQHCGRLQQ